MSSFFLHPGIAWAALGLISIPIIIHLIHRRRFRKMDWAAMEFLLEALKKNRRRIRLEQLILLLVRIAIMALLGLFLARPVLSDRGLEWIAGALRSEDKILLLDDSFSTSRRDSEKSAFQREIDALGLQIRKLADRGGGDRLTVLRGSRHKTPLVRGVFVDAERALQLAQTTSRLVPVGHAAAARGGPAIDHRDLRAGEFRLEPAASDLHTHRPARDRLAEPPGRGR
jgi:hypothetical protein